MSAKPARKRSSLSTAGWREWVGLPQLGVAHVKAKLDTGARTSALHAYHISPYRAGGKDRVRFGIHPWQRSKDDDVEARAIVLDKRTIRSSSGQVQERYVVSTTLAMGEEEWEIELTLASRDAMGFRLLLGREALRGRVLVHPGQSYLLSSDLRKQVRKVKKKRKVKQRPKR